MRTDLTQSPQSALCAIVIPTLNGRRQLERCLDSISWAPRNRTHIVVVDSGSTDGTVELARSRPGVTVLNATPDKWWAGATNIGCSWCSSSLGADLLCLLNHDCTWDEHSYQKLLAEAQRGPGDIHCSKVISRPPSRVVFAGGSVYWSGLLGMPSFGEDASLPRASSEVAWCGGMGVLMSSRLWRSLGGFDEQAFPHYYADSDFCFRARRCGARVRFWGESVVVNDRSTTGFSIPRRKATLGDFFDSLMSRRSPQNLRDTLRFYIRHLRLRAPVALAHLYARHTAMTLVRMMRD